MAWISDCLLFRKSWHRKILQWFRKYVCSLIWCVKISWFRVLWYSCFVSIKIPHLFVLMYVISQNRPLQKRQWEIWKKKMKSTFRKR